MKKLIIPIILLLFLTTGKLSATGIHFTKYTSYKQLLAIAKKQHKLIFLDGYASWCGPCKYLQQNVFTQTAVGAYYNKTFINAKMDMELGEGPTIAYKFKVTAYPTLFFINGDGKLVHKSVGALEAPELITLGHDAVNPKKQYYHMKNQAAAGKLNPAGFLAWLTQAERMSDDDAAAIVKDYLARPGIDLLQKDVLEVAMNHTDNLTGDQISRLLRDSLAVMKTQAISFREFNNTITGKVVSLALQETFKDSVLDIPRFRQIVAQYEPARAAVETQLMKVKYYSYKQDTVASLNALAACLDSAAYHLDPAQLTGAIEKSVKQIVAANRGDEFAAKIKAYQLSPDDAGLSYYPDVALLIVYHTMNNKEQNNLLVQKIAANTASPADLVDAVKKYTIDD